ncbi:MAG: hypothetical protein H6621_13280 [Halobacteriovoraceae bacterium]|nr:hypothetical protein [Halobacteriovoraceae bacterium]
MLKLQSFLSISIACLCYFSRPVFAQSTSSSQNSEQLSLANPEQVYSTLSQWSEKNSQTQETIQKFFNDFYQSFFKTNYHSVLKFQPEAHCLNDQIDAEKCLFMKVRYYDSEFKDESFDFEVYAHFEQLGDKIRISLAYNYPTALYFFYKLAPQSFRDNNALISHSTLEIDSQLNVLVKVSTEFMTKKSAIKKHILEVSEALEFAFNQIAKNQ